MRPAKNVSRTCAFGRCCAKAQWRPFLVIPVAERRRVTELQIDLGIAVCSQHRLPPRWDLARKDRRLARALSGMNIPPVRLRLASIIHLALE